MPAIRPRRVPCSTYRLQFGSGVGFKDARDLVPYLSNLGVTDLYASPLLVARPGSSHGYDITDHSRLNPELGEEADFAGLTGELRANSMGLLVDFVPNHMGVDAAANAWWRDVLENGQAAESARFFDIDWDPVVPQLKGKILLPILGNQYGVELEAGRLQIHYEDSGFSLRYWDHDLPLNPRPMWTLLAHDLDTLEESLGTGDPDLEEFRSILFQLEHLPTYSETEPHLVADRHRESRIARRRLAELTARHRGIREHVEGNVRLFNGRPGDPASFGRLHDLLEEQPYRLAHWRIAIHEINYRRFFDINDLAALRMEDPTVFEATHGLVERLVREGTVTGLRLDHVDGLYDPAGYFDRLQALFPGGQPVYVVVEKILSAGERLRPRWNVHGTTGYDYLNLANGLFVDASNADALRRVYEEFVERRVAFRDVAYAGKKVILTTSLASELNVLAHELARLSELDWRTRDFTLDSLRRALAEVVASFPVYRTYVDEEGPTPSDAETVQAAVRAASRRNPAMEAAIFEFLLEVLLPSPGGGVTDDLYHRRLDFARSFQQYTGPVQAKGIEDTAFYRYAPLASLNEVGGEPDVLGRSVEEFHQASQERLEHWPFSMLSSASHDTKRGEDARARLNVLSEMPGEFRSAVFEWARINESSRTLEEGVPAPDRHDEYLLYQTLLAAWPPELSGPPPEEFVARIREYMAKATKEAKVHTSWTNPSADYDRATAEFVEAVLTGAPAEGFLERFLPFQKGVAWLGMINSLAQLVLKIGSPGVPDFFQGAEMWDLSLVDPDNRRPVDFELRRRRLAEIEPLLERLESGGRAEGEIGLLWERWADGTLKLFVTAAALRFRRRYAKLFLEGEYAPLQTSGAKAQHVVGFSRTDEGLVALVLASRLVASVYSQEQQAPRDAAWDGTSIATPPIAGEWRNVLTGEKISGGDVLAAGEVFGELPVAILAGTTEGSSLAG